MAAPAAARKKVRAALRPRFQMACAMMAITTGLIPYKKLLGLRHRAEFYVGPGQCQDHEHGRSNEAGAGGDEAQPAGAQEADMDRHFGGIGSGDQVGSAEQVEEFLIREPLAALDDLGVHQADMRSRSAEGSEPQLSGTRRPLPEVRAAAMLSCQGMVMGRKFKWRRRVREDRRDNTHG